MSEKKTIDLGSITASEFYRRLSSPGAKLNVLRGAKNLEIELEKSLRYAPLQVLGDGLETYEGFKPLFAARNWTEMSEIQKANDALELSSKKTRNPQRVSVTEALEDAKEVLSKHGINAETPEKVGLYWSFTFQKWRQIPAGVSARWEGRVRPVLDRIAEQHGEGFTPDEGVYPEFDQLIEQSKSRPWIQSHVKLLDLPNDPSFEFGTEFAHAVMIVFAHSVFKHGFGLRMYKRKGRDRVKETRRSDQAQSLNMCMHLGCVVGFHYNAMLKKKHEFAALETYRRKEASALASGKASETKRSLRIAELWKHIDILSTANPDIVRFGPLSVAKLALEDAQDENPTLWSQGKGQIEQYIGEIRRGEAGAELQAKFFELFPRTP